MEDNGTHSIWIPHRDGRPHHTPAAARWRWPALTILVAMLLGGCAADAVGVRPAASNTAGSVIATQPAVAVPTLVPAVDGNPAEAGMGAVATLPDGWTGPFCAAQSELLALDQAIESGPLDKTKAGMGFWASELIDAGSRAAGTLKGVAGWTPAEALVTAELQEAQDGWRIGEQIVSGTIKTAKAALKTLRASQARVKSARKMSAVLPVGGCPG